MTLDILFFILGIFTYSVAITNLIATIFTILYQQYIYRIQFRRHYNPEYSPKCSIIVPVKGNNPRLKKCLRSLLKQNYPDYEVICTVEGKTDPSIPTIKEIIKDYPKAKLVISKSCRSCCQKNQNLLTALQHTNHPEVYVFADADMTVDYNWLKELVMPLSDPKITAASTYFWPYTSTGSLAQLNHAYMNIYTYTLYTYASGFFRTSLMWGGSMAISRKTFEKLKVAKYWSTTAVDDTSLSKLISDHRHRTVLVATALCQANDAIDSIGRSIDWYKRQIMYLKYYRPRLWSYIIGPFTTVYIINYLWIAIALVAAIFFGFPVWQTGISIPIFFFILVSLNATFYLFLGPIKRSYLLIFLAPILRINHVVAYLKSIFSDTINWSGITYQLKPTGEVRQVKR